MGKFSGGIINYFDNVSLEIESFFKRINNTKYEKNYSLTIKELSDEVFKLILYLNYSEFKNRKIKKNLKFTGIKKFNDSTRLELFVFFLFIAILSIQLSSIPFQLKKELANYTIKNFWKWLEENNKNIFDIKKIDILREQRFKLYEEAYTIIFEENNPANYLHGIDIIFDSFKDILRKNISKENIFDLLPLFLFFIERIKNYVPIFMEQIEQTEIVIK